MMVVLVEDDLDLLGLLVSELEARGHTVTAFDTAEGCLASDAIEGADVVLADFHLPGMDGAELCRQLLQKRPSLPVVIMTTGGGTEKAIAALRRGAVDYVIKPVTPADVEHRLGRAVRVAERRSRMRRREARVRLSTGHVVPGTPYQLVRWLGEGGMGTVFEALHVDIERRVALKVLHASQCESPIAVHTFRNEARASARIGAPNIVDILDFQELEDGRLMIAMEFLDGRDLAHAIEEPDFGVARMLGVCRQICKGLAAAHVAGIVHRDIKPENIMLLRREGREDFVKIVDFGIAAFTRDGDDPAAVAGTPQYMAPEVLSGEPADARADVYAMGCVLYEFLTGAPPFDGEVHDILEGHLERAVTPPSETGREVAPALEALVMRALAKNPDERYADMADLEAALCEAQIEVGLATPWDDLPLPAVDPERLAQLASRMPEHRPRTKRRSRLWAVAAVLAVALGGGVAFQLASAEPVASVMSEVDTRAASARAAAARFYFVYPPSADPSLPTAYLEVVALEGLETDAALERAAALRAEFTDTLVRLGDRYWDRDGGRAFATEYYAMALMFEPDHARADRVLLTPVALADLARKAEQGEFTSGELEGAAPLVALAEPDEGKRKRALASLKRDSKVSSSVLAELDRVSESAPAAKKKPRPKRPEAPVESEAGAPPSEEGVDVEEVATNDAQEEGSIKPSQEDPQRARELVKQGKAAAKRGDLDAALRLYHRALDANRRNVAALDGIARIHFDRGDYGRSVTFAERAARRAPSAKRWLDLGDAYFKVSRYSDAAQAYERAAAKGSDAAASRLAKVKKKIGP